MEEDIVIVTLTDLHPISDLFQKLKQKINGQIQIEFSLHNFSELKNESIEERSFNIAFSSELNILITGSSDHIKLFDLQTHKQIGNSIEYKDGVYGMDLEKGCSGEWNLIISNRQNQVCKYNFSRILKEKSFGDPIFRIPRTFSHAWAVRCFKTELYVVDYAACIYAYDLKTGVEREDIIVSLDNGMVDMTFTPEEEMIVCGISVFHILNFNPISSKWEIVKTFSNQNQQGIELGNGYGVWYERKSQLIYISDEYGSVYVFDRKLNLVKKFEANTPYGIAINEKNGELFLCETGLNKVSVYK